MEVHVVVRESQDGGYWATATSLPGCTVMGEDYDELMARIRQAVADCLARSDEVLDDEIDYVVEFAASS
jgi:predicted RNase H-like HicB family nuclease